MRWHAALWPLWPAAVVWLVYVFPVLVLSAPRLRAAEDWVGKLPWVLRAMLWTLEHTWPYSRLCRIRDRFDRIYPPRRPRMAHPDRPASYYIGTQLELPFD